MTDQLSAARALLVAPCDPRDLPPRIVIESFEGRDVPFDREAWRDRTLRLVRRRRVTGMEQPLPAS